MLVQALLVSVLASLQLIFMGIGSVGAAVPPDQRSDLLLLRPLRS